MTDDGSLPIITQPAAPTNTTISTAESHRNKRGGGRTEFPRAAWKLPCVSETYWMQLQLKEGVVPVGPPPEYVQFTRSKQPPAQYDV